MTSEGIKKRVRRPIHVGTIALKETDIITNDLLSPGVLVPLKWAYIMFLHPVPFSGK